MHISTNLGKYTRITRQQTCKKHEQNTFLNMKNKNVAERNTFFGNLPRADLQNRIQNRYFSENPKNPKNIMKNRFARGNYSKNQ